MTPTTPFSPSARYSAVTRVKPESAAAGFSAPVAEPVLLPTESQGAETLSEAEAKQALAEFGLAIPGQRRAADAAEAGEVVKDLRFPVVLKGEGLAHKSEAGVVRLGLRSASEVAEVARDMAAPSFLVEEMIEGGVAELLIGVVKDPAHGFVLTLAAGGVLTELLSDSVSLLVPSDRDMILAALSELKINRLLDGYRGAPAADMNAVLDAVEAVQNYVLANAEGLEEIEINPLIATPNGAFAADALLRKGS